MKKIWMILFGFLLIFGLSSCNGDDDPIDPSGSSKKTTYNGENMSLVNQDCHLYKKNALHVEEKINIFNAKNYGDVPYVDATELPHLFFSYSDVTLNPNYNDKKITLTKSGQNDCYITFDANNNEISYKNITRLPVDSSKEKNAIGHDYCLTSGVVIRSSSATKIGTQGKDEGKINLNSYSLKLFTENNKVFVPLELAITIMQPNFLEPIVYNGKDIFLNPLTYEDPTFTSLCYSGSGDFLYGYVKNGDKYAMTFKKVTPKEDNQAYLFYSTTMGKVDDSLQLALYKDGKGKFLEKNNGTITEAKFYNQIAVNSYKVKGDSLEIYISYFDPEQAKTVEVKEDNCEHTLKINLDETRFAKQKRSKEVADYTYNLLCFSFDNLYAIKADKKVTSFDKYFTDQGLKDKLKSDTLLTYAEGMYELLCQKIDDGHTSMLSLPIYEFPSSALMLQYETKYPARHTQEILTKSQQYYTARYQSFNFASHGIRIVENEDTAYLAFDTFAAGLDGIPANFNNYKGDIDLEDLREKDTCGYLASALMYIDKYNTDSANQVKIKNIVIDISCNGGGSMPVLPYVACLLTKDPALCMGDSRSGQVIEYHYEADFDGDGKYGDTYADKYNFFLLTSDASFSCGSSLPSMLKGTNVKIIGMAGAGGACPITSFTDGSGIMYQSSGYIGVFYKQNNEYISIESGVPVDYELKLEEMYDYVNLTKKIDGWVSAK